MKTVDHILLGTSGALLLFCWIGLVTGAVAVQLLYALTFVGTACAVVAFMRAGRRGRE